jgi:hypothetical protein
MKEEILDLGIAKIKLKPIEEKRIFMVGKCPFCERKVKGSSRSQMEWNMILHIGQKHKEDKDAKILLKQLAKKRKNR